MAKKASKKAAKTRKVAGKPAARRAAPAKPKKATKPAAKSAPPARAAKSAPARPAGPAKRPASKPAGRGPATRPVRHPVLRAPEPDLTTQVADEDVEEIVPVEPPLTPEEIEEFREVLLQKRRQIQGDLGSLQSEALKSNRREASGDLSSMPLHMADIGSDNYEMEFTLGLLESERSTLREIDEALERIRAGTFGICLGTGKPIGKARLRAKPWAKYCYEYTLARENQGRRY